jgi:Tfp pilus assembly protein PilE
VRLPAKPLRERGLTLIEVMGMVAILALISANQFANTLLERQQTVASKNLQIMMSIGSKIEKYCEDTQRACTGLASGPVTLPTDYMTAIPRDANTPIVDGLGAGTDATNEFQMTFNSYSDGSRCFSVEGNGMFAHDAVLGFAAADGNPLSVPNQTTYHYLHYDSRSGSVYATADNNSPVAGGC